MAKKKEYRYVRIETPKNVKIASEEGGLYISESMRAAKIFDKNKKEQLKLIDSSTKQISEILEKLKKLDTLLHEKSI